MKRVIRATRKTVGAIAKKMNRSRSDGLGLRLRPGRQIIRIRCQHSTHVVNRETYARKNYRVPHLSRPELLLQRKHIFLYVKMLCINVSCLTQFYKYLMAIIQHECNKANVLPWGSNEVTESPGHEKSTSLVGCYSCNYNDLKRLLTEDNIFMRIGYT